jgi:hypothetical protein
VKKKRKHNPRLKAIVQKARQAAKYRKALRRLNEIMDQFIQARDDYALMIYEDVGGDWDSFYAAVSRTRVAVSGRVNFSDRTAKQDLFNTAVRSAESKRKPGK